MMVGVAGESSEGVSVRLGCDAATAVGVRGEEETSETSTAADEESVVIGHFASGAETRLSSGEWYVAGVAGRGAATPFSFDSGVEANAHAGCFDGVSMTLLLKRTGDGDEERSW
jgi:hypothetical protein